MIGDLLSALYPWTTALHVMAVIAWMAGLFYLPRLFVYHVEAAGGSPEMTAAFVTMELKLLRIIMNPAMIAAWLFGLMAAFTPGIVAWSSDIWFHVKLLLVLAMTGFHMLLARWRRELATGTARRPGRFYRAMNEVPTLLMVGIVTMVIVRPF